MLAGRFLDWLWALWGTGSGTWGTYRWLVSVRYRRYALVPYTIVRRSSGGVDTEGTDSGYEGIGTGGAGSREGLALGYSWDRIASIIMQLA